MKIGTEVTVLRPTGILNSRGKMGIAARRGTYLGQQNGTRRVQHADGSQTHIDKGSPGSITTKHIDISPCGVKE